MFAFLLGCVSAFDAPARQTFVSELVGEDDLSNAVALNSTSFNAARMIGPAVAGILIAAVGSGLGIPDQRGLVRGRAVLAGLPARRRAASAADRRGASRGSLVEGFRYVWHAPDLKAVLFMLFLIGTFGLNFPIFISTMSVTRVPRGRRPIRPVDVDHGDRIGHRRAACGAAGQKPRIALLLTGAAAFGFGCALAALMPNYGLFGARARSLIGVVRADLHHHGEQHVQLSTEPAMRGRVMAIFLAIALGGTPHRRADRRLGRRHVRPALGAGRRRGRGLRRGDRRNPLPDEVPQPARARLRRTAALQRRPERMGRIRMNLWLKELRAPSWMRVRSRRRFVHNFRDS